MATEINLSQRSEAWFEWKINKIGSSMSSAIMGVNPYESALQLYNRMKGISPPKETTSAMARGTFLEIEALDWLKMDTGLEFTPTCYEDAEYPFLIASLDGENKNNRLICEIKVSDKRFELAKQGIIEPYDIAQVQHQLMTTGYDNAIYCVFDGFTGITLPIHRDDTYITELRAKEIEFYHRIQNNDPPPSTERQYVSVSINEFQNKLIDDWQSVNKLLKHYTDVEKQFRQQLCDLTDDGDTDLSYNGTMRLRLKRINRDGNVDWKAVCKEYGISELQVRKYRKDQVGYWKLEEI